MSFYSHSDSGINEIIDLAFQRNTAIMSQKKYLENLDTQVLASKFHFLPKLDLSYRHQNQLAFDHQSNTLALDAKFNIFAGGSDVANYKAYTHIYSSNQNKLTHLELSSEYEVLKSYFEYLYKFQLTNIYNELVKAKETAFKTSEVRFQKGFISLEEVQKLMIDLENSKAKFSDNQYSFQEITKSMEDLTGTNLFVNNWPFSYSQFEKMILSLHSISNKNDSHPLVQYKEMEVKSKEQLRKKSIGNFYPEINLGYSFFRTTQDGFSQNDKAVYVLLTMPLFDGLSRYASFTEASFEYHHSQYELTQAKRDYKKQMETSLIAFQTYFQTSKNRKTNLELSEKLYKSNFLKFKAGRSSVNDLLIEQSTLLDSQILALEGMKQLHLAYLQFCHTRGLRINSCLK